MIVFWLFFELISGVILTDIGTIDHIVIFMQENRAFDHYFGTLRGVRGFNDQTAVMLPTTGNSVWNQPVNSTYSQIPWHMDTLTTSATCVAEPAMDYPTDIAMWNNGYYDAWNTARDPGFGMSHFNRTDLEFYYELADAFTICDQYFQSTLTQTNPNRLHLFTGSNGLSVGAYPILDNTEPNPGFTWETLAETLEAVGISWKVYQQSDNFDDNAFAWFETFMKAKPGSPLYDKGIAIVPDLVAAFEKDIVSKNLPQVSWIIAPRALSEHATSHPQDGEDLSARLLAVLGANPEVYAKTVFFLNYDENGGFFDHVPPITPPANSEMGLSTVTTKGEITEYQKPIGFGFRVPMIIISPWTRGGYVNSQVFDHTSVVQFVEKRFNITCSNISPWRRAVSGDLLSAFNFTYPNYDWPKLPDTSGYVLQSLKECYFLPYPIIPIRPAFPVQEKGVKLSNPLPYEFGVEGFVSNSVILLNLTNTGNATYTSMVYDYVNVSKYVKHYTVQPKLYLTDKWEIPHNGVYNLVLHGVNGFVRSFGGNVTNGDSAEIKLTYIMPGSLKITLINNGLVPQVFKVTANAYMDKKSTWKFTVNSKSTVEEIWDISTYANWYDFSITIDTDPQFLRRVQGRMENGQTLTSDPLMGNIL